jgi:DNA-directed RNA polymerase specialized sigma24 family protein
MKLAESFGPYLPYLRRYARALTGDQQSGDAYLRATLEAIVADPKAFSPGDTPRVALYRYFHAIWGSTGARLEPDAKLGHVADHRLQALAPIERQAFLLTAVEGFSPFEAAQILGVSDAELAKFEAQAHRDIEAQLSTRVLIIEDEPIIAADLEALIEELGHTMIGNARTRNEAVAMARAERPGLVLCDIQLADGSSGIDAVADILKQFDVPVIFITAFPERLLTGERPEPTYLISKPFQENTVKATIGQALFFSAAVPVHPA